MFWIYIYFCSVWWSVVPWSSRPMNTESSRSSRRCFSPKLRSVTPRSSSTFNTLFSLSFFPSPNEIKAQVKESGRTCLNVWVSKLRCWNCSCREFLMERVQGAAARQSRRFSGESSPGAGRKVRVRGKRI